MIFGRALILSAAAIGGFGAAAEAGALKRGDTAEQRTLLRGEWERARAIGGYEDPITAFSNLFSGRTSARTVQPTLRVDGSTTIQDLRQNFRPADRPVVQ